MNSIQPPHPSADLAALAPGAARRLIRDGAHRGHTSGLAMGYLQGNLAVLPGDLALDFATFCQRNPKPCPLLAIGDRGDPRLPTLGRDIDLRTDLPGYRIWRHGRLVEEVSDIAEFWRDDFVAFVIGCSFSFEAALVEEGLEVRHVGLGCNVPMYASNIPCVAAGPFGGGMVVSMRPFRAADAIRAVEITSRFPLAHGAPVHLGNPAEIGIADLDKPDFGDPVPVRPGELPVFWACGVTPQVAIMNAAPEIAITHAPGRMLITDLPSKGGVAALPAP